MTGRRGKIGRKLTGFSVSEGRNMPGEGSGRKKTCGQVKTIKVYDTTMNSRAVFSRKFSGKHKSGPDGAFHFQVTIHQAEKCTCASGCFLYRGALPLPGDGVRKTSGNENYTQNSIFGTIFAKIWIVLTSRAACAPGRSVQWCNEDSMEA